MFSRIICFFLGHKWKIELEDIAFFNRFSMFSRHGYQYASKTCCRCKDIKILYREGLIGFGGPLSPSSCSAWKETKERTEHLNEEVCQSST